jgi:hypothetical protein
MKRFIALSVATVIATPTFTQFAAAAPLVRHQASQSEEAYAGPYDSRLDLTQTGPIHRGPIYRGYPLSDWYIY